MLTHTEVITVTTRFQELKLAKKTNPKYERFSN